MTGPAGLNASPYTRAAMVGAHTAQNASAGRGNSNSLNPAVVTSRRASWASGPSRASEASKAGGSALLTLVSTSVTFCAAP